MIAAFFDLDRTILSINSANAWFLSEWKQKRISKRELLKLTIWLARYHLGSAGSDTRAFDRAAAYLKSTPEAEMRERVHRWFQQDIAKKIRPKAQLAINQHKELGHKVVIATSGSIYSAEIASQCVGIQDYVASSFGVDANGQFDGTVNEIAYGKAKATAVQKWCNENAVAIEKSYFYTDSMTDVDLLRIVEHPNIVSPDRRLKLEAKNNNWPILDWD